jgi:hypothetical protein
VLLLLHFRRHAGAPIPNKGRWVRGGLPDVVPSELELLRLELVLPPATRRPSAEQMARAGLRKIADMLHMQAPLPQHLKQVQVVHGGLVAILAVPRGAAREWLRGSGCGGLYQRPFWTPSTGAAVARANFELLWVRGKLEDGPRLWEALHARPGVVGLLVSERDVAVRITAEADVANLRAQLQFVPNDRAAEFHRPVPGLRWWRLGPLNDAELWRVQKLIRATGLVPLREEVRIASAGPFRHNAFFAAHKPRP